MEKKRKAKWQNDYIAKSYDRINLCIPKGRKLTVKALAEAQGKEVNGFINMLLRDFAGLTEAEWKGAEAPNSPSEPLPPSGD